MICKGEIPLVMDTNMKKDGITSVTILKNYAFLYSPHKNNKGDIHSGVALGTLFISKFYQLFTNVKVWYIFLNIERVSKILRAFI